jgi:hypothetical protein
VAEHTPTTEEVRQRYAYDEWTDPQESDYAAFDRWLAAHDAEVLRDGGLVRVETAEKYRQRWEDAQAEVRRLSQRPAIEEVVRRLWTENASLTNMQARNLVEDVLALFPAPRETADERTRCLSVHRGVQCQGYWEHHLDETTHFHQGDEEYGGPSHNHHWEGPSWRSLRTRLEETHA